MFRHLIVKRKKIKRALLFMLVVFVLSSGIYVVKNEEKLSDYRQNMVSGYSVYINDEFIGKTIETGNIIDMIKRSKKSVERAVGYTPEYDYTLKIVPTKFGKDEKMCTNLEQRIRYSMSRVASLKKEGYVLKVGSTSVTLDSLKDVEEVIARAEGRFIEDYNSIKVVLEKDEHNPLVLIPKSTVMAKDLPSERIFVSSSLIDEPVEDFRSDDEPYFKSVVTNIELDRTIIVAKTPIDDGQAVDVETALNEITKENQTEKKYEVVAGDIPQTIAKKNNMTEERLYELNEGLRENSTKIQIGQKLTVMVPEQELTVKTEEKVIYTEKIKHENDYVPNDEEYVGTHTVIEEGKDGLLEVRALVKKENGKVISEEVVEKTVIKEPVKGKLTKGTKRLPLTSPTGTFEYPVKQYRFTSAFGYRWGRLHKGIDLANNIGTPVLASDGGTVIQAGYQRGFGNAIEIDHGDGYVTKYAHLSKILVSVGQEVAQLEHIGAMGNTGNSTGPHVHFEIRKDGVARNPLDYLN